MSSNTFAWGSEETKFFVELTPEKILSAVESVIGKRSTGRCLQLASMENRVYDIEVDEEDPKTKKPQSVIVKFYRPGRWSREQIADEHQFLFDLLDYDIPAVAPLKNEAGVSLHELEGVSIFFSVFPKVGGRSPDELDIGQLKQVGRLLARMHSVGETKEATGRINLNVETYGQSSLDFLLAEEILPEEIEEEYEDLVCDILDASEPLFEDKKTLRVHGDCHLGNLLWNDQGPFFVDFDDMVRAPAIQDVWLLVSGRDEYAIRNRDTLIEAYSSMRNFNSSELLLIEPLRSLRMIHFHAWIAKRWKDGAFPRAFPDFGSKRYWSEQMQALREQLELIENI